MASMHQLPTMADVSPLSNHTLVDNFAASHGSLESPRGDNDNEDDDEDDEEFERIEEKVSFD